MAEVLVFHHALGLTPGVVAFADGLRVDGNVVHAPDLYDGHTFTELSSGLDYAGETGFGTIAERGRAAADALAGELVYLGFSLGVLPAQMLAQTRRGCKGAVLLHACIPPEEFGPWPEGVGLQIHMMESDDIVQQEGDLDAANGLVDSVPGAELFLYPGDKHLFVDSGSPDYDPVAAKLVTERVLTFLAGT
jgi:dienelactone hydrolase